MLPSPDVLDVDESVEPPANQLQYRLQSHPSGFLAGRIAGTSFNVFDSAIMALNIPISSIVPICRGLGHIVVYIRFLIFQKCQSKMGQRLDSRTSAEWLKANDTRLEIRKQTDPTLRRRHCNRY
jgi:hypothetical protein